MKLYVIVARDLKQEMETPPRAPEGWQGLHGMLDSAKKRMKESGELRKLVKQIAEAALKSE